MIFSNAARWRIIPRRVPATRQWQITIFTTNPTTHTYTNTTTFQKYTLYTHGAHTYLLPTEYQRSNNICVHMCTSIRHRTMSSLPVLNCRGIKMYYFNKISCILNYLSGNEIRSLKIKSAKTKNKTRKTKGLRCSLTIA